MQQRNCRLKLKANYANETPNQDYVDQDMITRHNSKTWSFVHKILCNYRICIHNLIFDVYDLPNFNQINYIVFSYLIC